MLKNNAKEQLLKTIQANRLHELRTLLTGLDKTELQQLNTLIKDPEAFSEEIRKLLPLSIRKMVDAGDITMENLLPLIEEAMRESIQRNPETLADILFPVMMPAIRKAVATDIKQMLDSLNNTLERSFSFKRIGWRAQALLSSRKYSEIVLSHAYIYQVKQVFLIHKSTGLLLAQVADEQQGNVANADMVSSMLSAIKDFVQDSFVNNKGNVLEEINVGRMRIMLEQGPYAILASVVEGNIPKAYHDLLKESIENIHVEFFQELENFSGDISPFDKSIPLLKQCLQKEHKREKKRKPVFAMFLLFVLAAFLAYGIYLGINKHVRYRNLLNNLQNSPGIVITHSHNALFGKMAFYGIRDPMAQKPDYYLEQNNLKIKNVRFYFKPFLSLDPPIVLKRARRILKPPQTIKLNYKKGVLFVSGKADTAWLKSLYKRYHRIFGVEKLNVSTLLEKKNKKVVRNILAIEKHVFHFKYNVFALDSAQVKEFNALIKEVKNVLNFSFKQDSVPVIIVNSFTSYSGNIKGNKYVAQHRAEQFINLMIRYGIPQEVLVPKVRFIENYNNKFKNRSVSFQVKYIKPKNL